MGELKRLNIPKTYANGALITCQYNQTISSTEYKSLHQKLNEVLLEFGARYNAESQEQQTSFIKFQLHRVTWKGKFMNVARCKELESRMQTTDLGAQQIRIEFNFEYPIEENTDDTNHT